MDFYDFEKWVKCEFHINLEAYKYNQLHRRILSLMSRVGAHDFDDYVILLKNDSMQRQKFLDFITINVTEFFRNPELFNQLSDILNNNVLPENDNLKIWSAACSTGAEPYSLAMILDSAKIKRRFKIIATDIDSTILKKAEKGEYAKAELRNISNEYISKYFNVVNDNYCIDSNLKKMITFRKHDLILDSYDTGYDLIVCRNVVIYFKQEIKDEIYKKFVKSLKKGGLLFVGATESIYNYKEFGLDKASTFIYRKM